MRTKAKGMVFDIQRFSIDDGPGIRTTVFVKGCNLKCSWCHNPESQAARPELMYFRNRCISCGWCVKSCLQGARFLREGLQPGYDRELCTGCGACSGVCPTGALRLPGKYMSVEEVTAEVEKDRDFFRRSGGGLTVSGGEPFLQPAFTLSLLEEAKSRGIHTAVDTAGNVSWSLLESAVPFTDLFLWDVKSVNPQKHREGTGVDNRLILENLARLSGCCARIWIRIPVIPGFNDTIEDISAAAGRLAPLKGIRKIELLKYHALGLNKYVALDREYPCRELKAPGDELMKQFEKIVSDTCSGTEVAYR